MSARPIWLRVVTDVALGIPPAADYTPRMRLLYSRVEREVAARPGYVLSIPGDLPDAEAS